MRGGITTYLGLGRHVQKAGCLRSDDGEEMSLLPTCPPAHLPTCPLAHLRTGKTTTIGPFIRLEAFPRAWVERQESATMRCLMHVVLMLV